MTSEALKAMFEDLLVQSLIDKRAKEIICNWYGAARSAHGVECAKLALVIYGFSEAAAKTLRKSTRSHIEERVIVNMTGDGDFIHRGMKAERDIAASVVGEGNELSVGGNLNAFCTRVESSSLPDDLKSALKDAREAIELATLEPEDAKTLIARLGEVGAELLKEVPGRGLVRTSLAALQAFADQIPSLAALAAAVKRHLPWA